MQVQARKICLISAVMWGLSSAKTLHSKTRTGQETKGKIECSAKAKRKHPIKASAKILVKQ
jgi:hypothetical protein